MSIRVRLALSGVLVATLALLLFGVLLDRMVVYGTPSDQDRALAELADETLSLVRSADSSALASSALLALDDPDEGTESFVAVVEDGGRILATDADLAAVLPAVPRSVLEEAVRAGSARATVRLPSGTRLRLRLVRWARPDLARAGVVLAGQPTRYATEQIEGFRAFLVILGVLALASAAAAAWVVSGRALRPLRRLAATADEIGRTGDLGRRLPPVASRDVLGVLTASFNGMLERLQASQSRLADTVAGQRRFLAEVSHELRSPLTTIRSNAGFLREQPAAAAEDRAEALEDIAAEAERMSNLVDGLLALARAEAGEELAREAVDLAAVAEEAARRARAAREDVSVHVTGDVTVAGDRSALERLLWVLVDNGLRHGGGDVDVAIARRDDRVEVAVGDRGPGISDAELESVFTRFRRGSSAVGEGAGLGLAIARRLAQAHGGTIRAERRPGGDALLVVDLPAHDSSLIGGRRRR